MMRKAISLAALLLAGGANAQLFVDGATVVMDGEPQRMDVNIGADGTATMEAELVAEDGAETITGGWVTPGLFVPYSHVGLVDIGLEASTNDTRAGDAKTSVANRAADAFNPKAVAVANSRVEGVAYLATVPGSSGNVFDGTGSVVSTSGEFDSVVVEDAFIVANLGESSKGVAGGTRSAAMAQLREALNDAQRVGAGSDPDFGNVLTPRDARQLRRALSGDIPLVVTANRAADILRVIDLGEDYPGLDLIVLGASEAWQVADRLADAGLKVMIDPHDNLPSTFESVGARADNALLLNAAGVQFAFTTATADLTHNVRVVAQHAGNAVGEGLPWSKAFAAISTTPAEWFGVEADSLVVWSGDPLEVTSYPVAMFIDGERVPLRSRQTALRDRYNPLSTDERAHKYR